jgi:hypothetical protein
VQPGRELRLAAKLPDPRADLRERLLRRVARVLGVAQQVQRDPLHARLVPLAQGLEGTGVSVFGSSHEDRVAQALVRERRVCPQLSTDQTAVSARRLHEARLV